MERHSTTFEQQAGVITGRFEQSYAVTSFVGWQRCQLVIWANHRGVGHANLSWSRPEVMQLIDLFIDAGYRNRGLGKQVIRLIVATAQRQDCARIEGSVLLRDVRATPYLLAWLARQGFAIVPRPAHGAIAADITLIVPRTTSEDSYWIA
jgi:GNAT superfamily N-acetyltransferase